MSDVEDSQSEEEVQKKPTKSKAKKTVEKKKRKKKDANAPKRARSAYLFYTQATRATVKKENPDLSFGEIAKHIADQWKDLDADEKAPYEAQANKDKERYLKEKEAYVPEDNDDDDEDAPAKKKKKAAPKKKAAKKKAASEDEEDEDDDAGSD